MDPAPRKFTRYLRYHDAMMEGPKTALTGYLRYHVKARNAIRRGT